MVYDVIILGAGASGMMCAAHINENSDLNVLVVEGNDKVAKKLKISGGGKCNITNVNVSSDNYLGDEAIISSVFMQFSKDDLLLWLQERGLTPVIRKNQYYFCEKSSEEIISVLRKASTKSHYAFHHKILSLSKKEHFEVKTESGTFVSHKVVIATGAQSFAPLGASDIGLHLAQSFHHKIIPFSPALAGLTLQSKDFWMKSLSGISFAAEITVEGKVLNEDMLFTHKGLSGPVVLSASLYWKKGSVLLNFLPQKNLVDQMRNNRKLLSTTLPLPKRFTQELLDHLSIKDRACHLYKQEELEKLTTALQHYELSPAGTYGFAKAEVCKGGISTEQLNSWTLESNHEEGLYFCGEVVDVTGELGGYNFQWAFSSGVVVAQNITLS